jgi:hypothetical protein
MFRRIRIILILLAALLAVREVSTHSVRSLAFEIQEERTESNKEFATLKQESKTRLPRKPSIRETEKHPHQTHYKLPFIPRVDIPISKLVLHSRFLI